MYVWIINYLRWLLPASGTQPDVQRFDWAVPQDQVVHNGQVLIDGTARPHGCHA